MDAATRERFSKIEETQRETREILAHILAIQDENSSKLREFADMVEVQGRHTGILIDAVTQHERDPDAHSE